MLRYFFLTLSIFSYYAMQLPDTDAPFVFCLPDNIERSLQRVTSSGVIRQLRALSILDAEASKFDREKWRAQVTLIPILTCLYLPSRILFSIPFSFLSCPLITV